MKFSPWYRHQFLTLHFSKKCMVANFLDTFMVEKLATLSKIQIFAYRVEIYFFYKI